MAEVQREIETRVSVQKNRLERIQQALINFKKDSVSRKTRPYFTARLNQANDVYKQFIETHELLIALGVNSDHSYMKDEVFNNFEESHLELHCALTEKQEELASSNTQQISTLPTTNENNTTLQVKHTLSIQFARIPAPNFSGRFIDWPSFHDAFDQLINKNEELSNVQRFHYLKKALPIGRDADIHSMLMTDDNYDTAWELVTKRYDNARILFAHHMNSLYELPTLFKESSDDIKSLLNAATVCINEFKRLQIPIESCDYWLTHYLSTKLPSETHAAWERHLGSVTAIPSFSTFETFLTNRLFIIDAIEHRNIAHQSKAKPLTSSKSHKKPHEKGTSRPTFTHSFHMEQHEQHAVCALCQNNHIMRRCPSFLNKDCFQRNEAVLKHKLCLNCLSDKHVLQQCTSTKNFQQCGQRHHTLLHFPKPAHSTGIVRHDISSSKSNHTSTMSAEPSGSMSYTSQQVTSAHTNMGNAVSMSSPISAPSVLLATALVILQNPAIKQSSVFCALIDQGSEGTIISEHVVQTLRLQRQKFSSDISVVGGGISSTSKYVVTFSMISKSRSQFSTLVEMAHVLPKINICLPTRRVVPHSWNHLEGLDLADPTYYRPKRIDLIVGADIYPSINLSGLRLGSATQPVAQNTQLGWVLSGENITTRS